ncbi:hypothetical protein BTVI_83060 [Pitangus sulphuratus]|nr:hypothetical protein BTVI_83060 [Pitangus sulphuratus]
MQDEQGINASQHGFVKGRSCLTKLSSFYDKMNYVVDEEKTVNVIYLNFSKVFDTVSHSILEKLSAHGLVGWPLQRVIDSPTRGDALLHLLVTSAGEVLQPSGQLCGPPLDLFQQVYILKLGAPEPDAVLLVGSHKGRKEEQNRLPRPAVHVSFDAAQNAFSAASAHGWLMSSISSISNPKSFLAGLLLISSSPSLY